MSLLEDMNIRILEDMNIRILEDMNIRKIYINLSTFKKYVL